MVADAACLFKREPKYFPFPSLWWLSSFFELTSCLSAVIFIPLCAYLSRIDLCLLLFLHLFTTHLPPTSRGFFGCFHSLLFRVFILSFPFFFLFLFLIQFFLSLLSCSHSKLQIPYPVLSGHSCKVFPMSVVTFCWCVLKTWRQM